MSEKIKFNIPEQKEREPKEPKDVIFIDPPIHTDQELAYSLLDDSLRGQEIPKGAHSIASLLKKSNVKSVVIVTDAFLKTEEYVSKTPEEMSKNLKRLLKDKIEHFNSPVIALNLMYTFAQPTVLEMAQFIKEKYPEKIVVVGGNHATFSSDYLLDPQNKTGIDIVVKGEGEWTMKELMEKIKEGNIDLSGIRGISYLDTKTHKVKHNDPRERGNLKTLPPLDYALIHKPEETSILNFNHTVMFARACRGNCAFCTSPEMWNRNSTYATIKNFEQEIDFLVKNGIDIISVLDDDIMVSEEVFDQIIQVLAAEKEKHPEIKFLAQTRVDNLRDAESAKKAMEKMVKAGIKRLYLGVESGSQKILNSMRKGYRVEWVKEACVNVKKYSGNKVEVGAFWLLGHPGANMETEEESLLFLEKLLKEGLIDDVEIHNTVPFPGTAINKDPRIKIFDENLKHYGFLNNYPVYDLVDPNERSRTVLSAEQIFDFQKRALKLREKYLGISKTIANKPIE
jgi:radical SAM superfamily enzyme YgiQ (UPF0313 family)